MGIDVKELTSRYADDGYVFPVDIISASDAQSIFADFTAAETELANDPEKLSLLRSHPDRLLPSFDALIRHPNVIDAVSSLLGPDLMVWSGSVFDKAAQSDKIVSWHQDLTYWGLDDAEEVTAWIALTPATVASGCMQFVPGSHKQLQVDHVDTFSENNLLTRGQEIAVEVEEGQGVPVELEPGQASLHHGHLFHSSGPNNSKQRRLGVAVRYIKPSMKQQTGERSLVALVSGEDKFNHFAMAGKPLDRLHEDDFERCRHDAELKRELLYRGAER